MARIDAFLKLGLAQGCSDVHLAVGVPPMLRLHGDLMPIKFRDLGAVELESYVSEILTPAQKERFGTGRDVDFSYVSEDGGRFRVNVFRKETGVGATFRFIPGDVPKLEKLHLPAVVQKLCDHHQGMILLASAEALLDHPFQRAFHANPHVRATERLLDERVPRTIVADVPEQPRLLMPEESVA